MKLIHCDGPGCQAEGRAAAYLSAYPGWYTLTHEGREYGSAEEVHLCSYRCIARWAMDRAPQVTRTPRQAHGHPSTEPHGHVHEGDFIHTTPAT